MGVLIVVRSRAGKDGGWSQTSLGISFEKKLKRSGLKSTIATVVRRGPRRGKWRRSSAQASHCLPIGFLVFQRVDTKPLASFDSFQEAGLIIEPVQRHGIVKGPEDLGQVWVRSAGRFGGQTVEQSSGVGAGTEKKSSGWGRK